MIGFALTIIVPIGYLWERLAGNTEGKCIEYFSAAVTSSSLTVVMDVVLVRIQSISVS